MPTSSRSSGPVARPPGGHERLLIVEDETSVRRVVVQTFRHLGYTVLEARNGHEALECFAAANGAIDLLVTDVVMPELDGAALLRELRTRVPLLPAVVISGYVPDTSPIRLSVPVDHRTRFLLKPFGLDELAREVRALLDQYPHSARNG